ncbi:LLM class flavin-dependent oxidoreductase [Dictyobacter arantiisoli]|uniref:Luciferase-like domain-containing protein n=1 Tax=Dictyobacter arantiisoli TaxID=2014874 RepID=A0A5A5THW2_9CHLR|nr:LLM class flavin-dependent oxidoreductase [Dictyobacter arantiisoli]GCF10815.1 hypothetical protein KDI_43790 [Dictyobacter arantiisoli]
MAQIQFGFNPMAIGNLGSSQHEHLNQLRAALDTIVGHFDGVWLPDHVQFGTTPILENWTTLTYLAGMRPELRYGHLVLNQLFRNPALLAKMAATFQYMSQGHFILGIGAGWAEEEARAYNRPFPPAGQRISELEEQLQIINALWREESVTFEGKYHQVHNAKCLPRPEPLPPILIAGVQPRMLRLVVRYADWWNTTATTLDKAREQLKALDAACEEIGRDPKTLRRTLLVKCYCAPTEQKLDENLVKLQEPIGMHITGTPAQIVEQLQPCIEMGFDYYIIVARDFPRELTTLELLAHEVLPALNKAH